VEDLLLLGVPEEAIGVITPYDDQVNEISKVLSPSIRVSTVDGFQGREKEVIILSFVRSNPRGEIGFLADTRRLNVALTRARAKLIAIGDGKTLSHHELYRDFIAFARRRGLYLSLTL